MIAFVLLLWLVFMLGFGLQHGYNIYRVTNGAVLDRPEEVAQDIYDWLRELAWRKSA